MPNYLIPTTDLVPVYDRRNGMEVGRLKINEPVLIGTSDTTNHHIRFGTGAALVERAKCKVVTSNVPPSGSEYKPTTLAVREDLPFIATDVLTGYVNVYDSTNTKVIAQLAPGIQMGLIGGNSAGFLAIKLGDRIARIKATEVRDSLGVPILCYHNLQAPEDYTNDGTVMRTTEFNQQLQWLKDWGYEVIDLDVLELYMNRDQTLKIKTVAITFDDGSKSNHKYALPELRKHNFKATEFFITARMRDIPVETWDPTKNQILVKSEMQEMLDMFRFENHTHDMHRQVIYNGEERPQMIAEGPDAIIADMKQNRDVLVSHGFAPSKYLAYPFGGRDDEAVQAVKDSGVVNLAFTIESGVHCLHNTDKFQIPRHMMGEYYYPQSRFEAAIKVK